MLYNYFEMEGSTKILLVLFVLSSAVFGQVKLIPNQINDLTFQLVFKIFPLLNLEEAENFLSINYDDSNWKNFYAPGSWENSPYQQHRGPVIYRLTFFLDKVPENQFAFYLGYGIDNDWTYINGHFLGHNGILEKIETYTAYDVQRFYLVPISALQPGKNVLAIVIKPYSRVGIFHGNILIGPVHLIKDTLLLENLILSIFLGIYSLVGFSFLLLAIRSPKEKVNWGFSLFILFFTIYFFIRSHLKFSISLDYLLLKRLEIIVIAIAPNFFLYFLLNFFNIKHTRLHFTFYGISFLSILLLMVAPENKHWSSILFYLLQPSWIFLMGLSLWILIKNFSKHPDAKSMTISIGLVILALLYDIFVSRQIYLFPRIQFISQFAFAFYILTTSWNLASRYRRMYHKLEEMVEERTASLKKANEELERIATHDHLTGLYNRMEWHRRLGGEWDRFRRYRMSINKPFSILFIDLDNFKMVNDSYGHQAGDELLIMLSDIMKTKLRSVDISARFGGDEFVLLLPETDAQSAQIVANKILLEFHEKLKTLMDNWTQKSSGVIPAYKYPGMSVGIAECPENVEISPDQLIQKADKALYAAKEAGKGKVVVAL